MDSEEKQHWRGIGDQCAEDAWHMYVRLLHHFYGEPEAWAKAYAIGLPVVKGEKTVHAAEVKHAFMQALGRRPDPPGLLSRAMS